MKILNAFARAVLLLPISVLAQSPTSSTTSDVPSGTPVAGDYGGPYRPQIHFSPPQGFMNDPNGMFKDVDGVYHLYYQLNPTDVVAGFQHWGHAISRDLYTWENQPIALYPSTSEETIFSGSCVIDPNNTSGFFPNQTNGVVAIYTLNTPNDQAQSIAYSRDNGYTFEKYADNPVLSVNSTQFRDPKVFWYEDHWVMAIAYSQDYTIAIYTSPDLKTWMHASNFTNYGLLGLQYECPNLIELPMLRNASVPDLFASDNIESTMWLMFISINPGAPLGGSASEYFPGTFNGTHFAAVDGAARLSDFAKDNYAGQFFSNVAPDAPQIGLAWASNWQYTQAVPTAAEGFRSAMSLPRLTALANITRTSYALLSTPVPLTPLRTTSEPLAASASLGNGSLLLDVAAEAPSGALSFGLRASGIPEKPLGWLNFTLLSAATGEMLCGGFQLGGDPTFFLDRSGARGFADVFFTGQASVSHILDARTGAFAMEVVLDRSVVEVFLDGGVRSGTAVYFMEGTPDVLTLSSEVDVGVTVEAEVWGLKSTWEQQGGSYVQGNSSQVEKRAS